MTMSAQRGSSDRRHPGAASAEVPVANADQARIWLRGRDSVAEDTAIPIDAAFQHQGRADLGGQRHLLPQHVAPSIP